MARGDDTAYARNWRTVVAVDALVGLAAVVLGLVLLVGGGQVVVGGLLAAAGLVYLVLVGRRAARWRRLRRKRGLS